MILRSILCPSSFPSQLLATTKKKSPSLRMTSNHLKVWIKKMQRADISWKVLVKKSTRMMETTPVMEKTGDAEDDEEAR